MLMALSFLIAPFPKPSAPAYGATQDITIIDDNVLKYVSISTAELKLTPDKLKTIDTNDDGKKDTSFIISNGTISLNFKPFEYNYTANFDESLFYPSKFSITLDKDGDNFPTSFEYKNNSITYQKDASGTYTFKIDGATATVSNKLSEFIEVDDSRDDQLKFTFKTGYTLKADSPNTTFSFSAGNTAVALGATSYTLHFERPIVDFKTEYVTHFTWKSLENNNIYDNEIIERERAYEYMQLQFTNNNYTKNNPLYFDINYNGFIYTFMLYSETISSTEYLFVEYYDEQRPQNNTSLATILNTNGTVKTPVKKYINDSTDFNMFSIDFNQTGRYEVSVYDSTYLLLKNKNTHKVDSNNNKNAGNKPESTPNDSEVTYNFYQRSFYIKTSEENSVSSFDNAYVIMQSYDDDGNYLDYIVSTSTQNNNVQINVKNLEYYFDNDEAIKNFVASEELPDLQVVEFIKTTLDGSANIPVSTLYSVSELRELVNNNKDFNIDCTDDAFYEIILYQFDPITYKQIARKAYHFTIVKQPKVSFTVYEVDTNNDPIEIPGSNPKEYKKIIREADTLYKIKPVTYKMNINEKMTFSIFFSEKLIPEYHNNHEDLPDSDDITLKKTYLNEYVIGFAMQEVSIEQFTAPDPNNEDGTLLGIRFWGVGEINVKLTINSTTTSYTVQSGGSLTFSAYGTYFISIEDSMGTDGNTVINYAKPTNTSTLLLIGLVGVIVLAVVLFIVTSRTKPSTR